MADVFVNSAATGGGTGADWPNAFTTLAAGVAALSNGDRLIWAESSSESASTNTTVSFPGNNTIISSTVSGTNTITYSPATSAQFSISTTNVLTLDGNNSAMLGCYVVSGVSLNLSDGWYTEDCTLACGNGGNNGPSIEVIGNGSTWKSVNDTRMNLSTLSVQPVIESGSRTTACLLGGTVSSARTSNNTNHVAFEAVNTSTITACGVDCSGFQMSRLSDLPSGGYLNLDRIRLNALTTQMYNESSTERALEVYMTAVDDANEVNRQYYFSWTGGVDTDTSIALDTTDPSSDSVSLQFDSSANAQEYFEPLRYPISYGWVDFSSARTFSVEFVQDGASTLLNNAQVWIELRAPDGTTSAYDLFTTKASDNQSGTNYPASTAAWTGLSATNSRQTASLTTDGTGKAGPYSLYFCVSPASTTVNVNPAPGIS